MKRLHGQTVSVITTAYNAGKFIGQTIHSILQQDYEYFEYIIVDDGSNDDTVEVIKRFSDAKLRLIEAGRIGRGQALNLAIKESKGNYIAIQDADDLSHPQRLSIQIECLNQKVHLLGTKETLFQNGDPMKWEKVPHPPNFHEMITDVTGTLVYYNPIPHTSVMMSRELVDRVGGYNEKRKNLFDWDLYIRTAASGYRIHKLPLPLVGKRLHKSQFFENKKRMSYVYNSSKLQLRAAFFCCRNPFCVLSLPILFVYRLFPNKGRMAIRKYLRLSGK
ncbi:MAG: glycosyltransferase [Thermodesulfobacteriota bacterium]